MKKPLFYIATLLTLLCCSEHPGIVRIQGKFAHLEQGEFLIYSTDVGLDRMDSLHIRDGRFAYDLPLDGIATMQILYPNFSRLTVFAQSGDDIKIEGDAQNLSEVKVTGTEDNELYTRFRLESLNMSEPDTREVARKYILQSPATAMSQYLFREYFLLADSLDPKNVQTVYDSLRRANPDDVGLIRLSKTVQAYGLLKPGQRIPDFELKLRKSPEAKDADKKKKNEEEKNVGKTGKKRNREERKDTLRSADIEGGYLLAVFWASWKSGSQSGLFRARTFRRKIKKEHKLTVLSYSLDVEDDPLRRAEERDSVNYPSYCDFQAWRSPLAEQLNIRELPYFILVGPDRKIIACGTDWMRDIEPKALVLCL